MQFFTGTHRSQSVVLALTYGPLTAQEINATIPPHDLEWTRIIIEDLMVRGFVQRAQAEGYELTEIGHQMAKTLQVTLGPVKK